MADAGSTKTDEAARLEAALERIAQNRTRAGRPAETGGHTAEIARRLDALIVELRTLLGRDSAD